MMEVSDLGPGPSQSFFFVFLKSFLTGSQLMYFPPGLESVIISCQDFCAFFVCLKPIVIWPFICALAANWAPASSNATWPLPSSCHRPTSSGPASSSTGAHRSTWPPWSPCPSDQTRMQIQSSRSIVEIITLTLLPYFSSSVANVSSQKGLEF